jgi:hypothetical protein
MTEKTDKFTAARIRLFTATGMAVQKALPFDRPRLSGQTRLDNAGPQMSQQQSARVASNQRHAS